MHRKTTTSAILILVLLADYVNGAIVSINRRGSAGLSRRPNYYNAPPADPYAAERQRLAQIELKKQIEAARSQAEAQHAKDLLEFWQNFIPEDPYRTYNGTTVFAKGNGWVKFGGKILDVSPSGILVDGSFKTIDDPFHPRVFKGKFVVRNFPYTSANTTQALCAEPDSDFTAFELAAYDTGTNLVRELDYGIVNCPPAPSNEVVKYVVQAAETDIATNEKTLQWNQELADKGDAFGQLRMGERYLNGDGVEKNSKKAYEYISKAAAQGNTDATNLLQKLKP